MKINNFLIVTTLFCSFACVQTSKKVNETDASATAADEDPVAPTLVAGVDSLINHLWHLKNTSYANADINLGTLHQTTTGKDVVVAVSDSNMELTHEDLYFNSSKNLSRNYTLDSANWYGKYPTTSKNTEFHGTSVSGLIAATANNTVGGIGVAPGATLAGFNYLNSSQDIERTIDQAQGNQIDIFNYSYGYTTCRISTIQPGHKLALLEGVTSARNGLGAIYVKAAGNDYSGDQSDCGGTKNTYFLGNSNFDQENALPYMIIVGATNVEGKSADYSSPGANLWVSAPGGEATGTPVSDLGIELTSPSGTKSTLLNYNSSIVTTNLENSSFLSNAFYMEPSLGTWSIKVFDAKNNNSTGKLLEWSLTIHGASLQN